MTPMESISRISSVLESGMSLDSQIYICSVRRVLISTARDLTLDAAQAARSSRSSTKTPPAAQIKKLLDSRNDREVLDGLRRVTSVRVSGDFGAPRGVGFLDGFEHCSTSQEGITYQKA